MISLIEKSKKILKNDNIPKNIAIKLENDCLKQIAIMNKNLESCIDMFNNLIIGIGNIIKLECSTNYVINIYSCYIENIIKKDPIEPISKFIINIYSNDLYRQYIIEENEKFFITSKNIVNDEDAEKILHIRSCWKKLSQSAKTYIKNALKTMIDITDLYIIKKDDGNTIMSVLRELKLKTKYIN